MPPRELIVIADGSGQSDLPQVIADLPVRFIDWQDTGEISSIGDAPLLVDVDLHDVSKVKGIKDSLPNRIGNACRIIAVDRRSHLCEVQANGLGASAVLKRPLNMQELSACLRHHFPAPKPASSEAGQRPLGTYQRDLATEPESASIALAATALDGIFTSLKRGDSLELESVMQSGDQVIDAVAEVGLAKWLDTVRNYHESTFQHCLIVTGILTAFGHKNGMRRADVLTLTVAGLLHDIGKAQIPLEILDKPGKLTEEEFMVIKRHPVIGFDYLRVQNSVSPETLRAVRHHHEYLDGSGYPDGLMAQQIDDLTRIMTICDVYGALVERRSYKQARSPRAALDILAGMAKAKKVEYDLVKALEHSVAA